MINKRRPLRQEPETDPNAEKVAVALKYDAEENTAPKITAKGKGHVAEKILEAGKNNAVPVYRNKSLVNLLMALDIDKEIPADLYTMVAEVLAYVYRLDKKAKNKIMRY